MICLFYLMYTLLSTKKPLNCVGFVNQCVKNINISKCGSSPVIISGAYRHDSAYIPQIFRRFAPGIPGINSLSGNSSVIRPLFFARKLHRLFESVFNRAGEQSVTFGGKDEQRRERAPFFVKKRSKLLIACSGLVRLMGLSAQISFVPRSKERSAGAFCPASSP